MIEEKEVSEVYGQVKLSRETAGRLELCIVDLEIKLESVLSAPLNCEGQAEEKTKAYQCTLASEMFDSNDRVNGLCSRLQGITRRIQL